MLGPLPDSRVCALDETAGCPSGSRRSRAERSACITPIHRGLRRLGIKALDAYCNEQVLENAHVLRESCDALASTASSCPGKGSLEEEYFQRQAYSLLNGELSFSLMQDTVQVFQKIAAYLRREQEEQQRITSVP